MGTLTRGWAHSPLARLTTTCNEGTDAIILAGPVAGFLCLSTMCHHEFKWFNEKWGVVRLFYGLCSTSAVGFADTSFSTPS